jgi:hypothetical protein
MLWISKLKVSIKKQVGREKTKLRGPTVTMKEIIKNTK